MLICLPPRTASFYRRVLTPTIHCLQLSAHGRILFLEAEIRKQYSLLFPPSRQPRAVSLIIRSRVLSLLLQPLAKWTLGAKHLTISDEDKGIGDRAKHKKPKKLHAQPMPRLSYMGYVASGRNKAATIFRLSTDETNADAG